MNKIIKAILETVLVNRLTIFIYSLLPRKCILDFTDKVYRARFDRSMEGFDREAMVKMITNRPPGDFVMGIREIGSMGFDKLPVDISDKSEPEVKVFTKEDVVKSEYILADTVVDGAQKVQVSEDELKSFAAFNNIKD